ncbi:DUF4240 domain-containing protein [Allorhizocola rhizosphaerae]|uniref:DUF4240 domain-containing protein n=1 Tax=Allorhizocola rhizosphaerae TaxID=1872709 RepID=UPI000E3BF960|nr:DUF4240 domain-containing protein [Allorhizocola rhizosphaerae]
MQQDTFWQVVEASRDQVSDSLIDVDNIAEAMVDRLVTLSPAEIVEFHHVLDGLLRESYRRDLWAAAYLINGGCSDDGFDYFRGWLIAQGHKVWQAALAEPDSLAAIVTVPFVEMFGAAEGESVLGVASAAYEQVTGDYHGFWDAVSSVEVTRPDAHDSGPAGEDFDFDDDDQMRVRLPRLFALVAQASFDDVDDDDVEAE